MLDIHVSDSGEIFLAGRLDAMQVSDALEIFNIVSSSCDVNFENLEYISSAGLGVLLKTQKRLSETGHQLKLIGMNPFVRLVFETAGFDHIFVLD